MRVLYVHQYFGTPQGTGGTRSYEMGKALVQAGHEVTMICASADRSTTGIGGPFVGGRREGVVDGMRVIEFSVGYSNQSSILRRAWHFTVFARRAVIASLTEKYDLIFATSTPLTAALPGVAARWLRGKPFVFEVRDLWPELPRAMGLKNPVALFAMTVMERLAYRSARRVIALAPGIRDGVTSTGFPVDRVALIPNGCDNGLFDSATPLHPSERFPGEISRQDFVAVFAGAHGRANGLDAVIGAARVLESRGRTDIKLLLIGNGSEKQRLKAAADGLTNVVFASAIPKAELLGLLRGADVGLQILANIPAFYRGTSPNKFFDYLAAGRPVLINYPGWLAELVEERRAGWAVPPSDPAAFADALEAAAGDRAEVERRASSAKILGRESFDRVDLAAEFVRTLESAVAVPAGAAKRGSDAAKRILDVVASGAGLVLLAPVLLVVALLIRLNLGSPVLFRQIRPGRNGRLFELVKFRTMTSSADASASDAQRLTPFGRMLRASSLDELPELWNILSGDMSLVGPRPLLTQYLPLYTPQQARRHEVRPGLTGWAQVNGRNSLSWQDRFDLDVWYVDNRSFLLDLKILAMTVFKVLRREDVAAADHVTMPVFTGSPTDKEAGH